MSEPASKDRLTRLDERHVELLDELDALNQRLEETLNSLTKPSESPAQPST